MTGAILSLALAVSVTLFVLSFLAVPLLPASPFGHPKTRPERVPAASLPRRAPVAGWLLSRERELLLREMQRSQKLQNLNLARFAPPQAGSAAPVVAAFYAPWQETGLASLRANAAHLTHVFPAWLHLDAKGTGLSTQDFDLGLSPGNREIIALCKKRGIALCPLLSNAHNDSFDAKRAHVLLASPHNRALLVIQLKEWLMRNQFQGLNLDFESLSAPDYLLLCQFARELQNAFAPAHLSLSADIETDTALPVVASLAQNCDFLIAMAYDQHSEEGTPGPIAAASWVSGQLNRLLGAVPPQKLVMGVGNYAYDWAPGQKTESLTYQSALFTATDNSPDQKPQNIVDFDGQSLNATYSYLDEAGREHEVWMLDAASAYNQWQMAQRAHLRGSALWALGSEDPSLWTFFRRDAAAKFSAETLSQVRFPYEVEFNGDGEILSVASTPVVGARDLDIDPKTGLITDQEYTRFPSPYVMKCSGYKPHELTLTFDDGPDPNWTPQVLDELHTLGVKASFFVVGENAESYPGLVQRIYDEGHEIGNHSFTHPNLGLTSTRRTLLEINATQRAIEGITGHSTQLFRPPYNADSQPETAEQVTPVAQAAALGYVTVGELIDPQDWSQFTEKAGRAVPRTVADLHAALLSDLAHSHGSVILLHDAGGDRSKTLQLLREIVPELRARGYRFVSLSQLLDTSRGVLMPAIPLRERVMVSFERFMFRGVFGSKKLLSMAFIAAIFLGIARLFLVVPLALVARRREKTRVFDPEFAPLVSVLVAAYNEEKVIARTIDSILGSTYPRLEIIVIDDGSKDQTARQVREHFGSLSQLRLIVQPNGGKAAALNTGLEHARGEIIVGFDADTQVAPDAIALLVRHFDDARVGAVAGNVKVGNRINLLTRWQAIEYITSQNLDRRAYGMLNALTVVPGAIGAWRASAVRAVGGYRTDTLAEDMDLTWRLRRAGWILTSESSALAFTEAPDTLRALFKQRFRWTYGTLQCLCKHRGALGRYGFFGALALPTLWLFQIGLQILAPAVDLQLLSAAASLGWGFFQSGVMHSHWVAPPGASESLAKIGFFYALFFAIEIAGALVAFRLDRERLSLLWWLFWQRFVYRQLLYVVAWKSLLTALGGAAQSWNKLLRKGTVTHTVTQRPNEKTAPEATSVTSRTIEGA